MRTIVLQLNLTWHDRDANHAKAAAALAAAKPLAGDLVVLPEAFGMGFTMDIDRAADMRGETTQFIRDLAKQHNVFVIGGNMIKPDERGRNIAIVAAPDGTLIDTFEKLHPFTFAKEHERFKGGSRIVQFDWGGAKVSPIICYDLRFPEVFRVAAKTGTEIFVVIANWPTPRLHHWLSLLTARAIENQAYVIGCNRCGNDPNVPYPGRSVVIDPRGQIIADAGDAETALVAAIDLNALHEYRKQFPALNDMRFVPDRLI